MGLLGVWVSPNFAFEHCDAETLNLVYAVEVDII